MNNVVQVNENLENTDEGLEGHMRIGDVAKTFDVTLRTLRFYEDKGLVSPLRRGNTRLYSHADLKQLKLIMLGRKAGFSLREIKQLLDMFNFGDSNDDQLRVLISKSQKQLGVLQKQRTEIENTISELGAAIDRWNIELATEGRLSSPAI